MCHTQPDPQTDFHLHLSPDPSSSQLCWCSGPLAALQWNKLCLEGPDSSYGGWPLLLLDKSCFVISDAKKSCTSLSIRTTTTCKHYHILVHVFTEHSTPSKNIRFGPIIEDVTQAFILEVKFTYWPLSSMYLSSSVTTKYSWCPKTIPKDCSQCKEPRNIFLSLASITHSPGAF